jgi:hypothetical protein
MFVACMLQIQAMAAMQDEFGPKSVTVLVTWVDGQVHFEVRPLAGASCRLDQPVIIL